MAHTPLTTPPLTPQFCLNQRALRDFLRLSRATIDDNIIQNLNALIVPSRTPFNPSSTSARSTTTSPPLKSPIDPPACENFKSSILFPSWESRSDVLNYCAAVALNPADPDLALAKAESAKERERVVDERLDPYSGRFFPREARTEVLGGLVRNERSVERIVRGRTWGLVQERCGEGSGEGWEEALDKWREEQERR
ncbi:MAG: hypothetical protein HETSPECPRED_009973 [Heterodermia speciosa]|uniref:Caffeine-induced death protein Cid2 n=1 Tax=Heterodermia speciosa TaxID=116794 RepID=A0A8H3G3P7_9LECA|nr:MAG: hypothetical protein HETSPECPRED_009973 [Heterodermia speciosa]